MKSGTPGHIKTKKLKLRLKIPLWQAIGILESLWQFAADCADDGAIGRYSNDDIAAYMEWDGDADELVDALVQSRWVDEDDADRLVVHDWEEHCPNYVKDRVKKRNERLATKKPGTRLERVPQNPGQSQDSHDEIRRVQGQSQLTQPTQPRKPNPTEANPTSSGRSLRFDEEDMGLAVWMFGLIQTMQPERKEPNLDSWANTFRLMRENDGRAPPDIRSLFEWCNRDSFWKTNVLSPDKLREKWDDLQLKRKNDRNGPTKPTAGHVYDRNAVSDLG